MHIFETPFYYIDYCLAQTVALWFLKMSRDDYSTALQKYVEFSRAGGTKSFGKLLEDAGIPSPFGEGSLKVLCDECEKIIDELHA
jgi:oligoendopeptidase F